MLLSGYVRGFENGFALPCYATGSQANIWYVAICSVDGDHSGTITGFSLFDTERVLKLPEAQQRKIAVGAQWQDVFFWADKAYVGLPADILRDLHAHVEEIASEAPISLLDLALSSGEGDVCGLVQTAFEHINRRYGAEMADTWFREMLVREQVQLVTRRLVVEAELSHALLKDVQQIVVRKINGRFQITLPKTIAHALSGESRLGEIEDLIQMFAAAVNTHIDVMQSDDSYKVDSHHRTTSPEEEEFEEATHPPNILIVVSGKRARAISRHLNAPDWLPVFQRQFTKFRNFVLRRNPELGQTRPNWSVSQGKIDIVDESRLQSAQGDYTTIVWLVDDQVILDEKPSVLKSISSASKDALFLVAPALPIHGPSRALSRIDKIPADDVQLDCVIDTSLARSPFWTGNPRRAIDRRIGDIIIGSASISALDQRLRYELIKNRPKYDLKLLSFALVDDGLNSPNPELGLLSESSFTSLKPPLQQGIVETIGRFRVQPFSKQSIGISSGYYSIRQHDPDFRLFVEAVVADLARGEASVRLPEQFELRFDPQYDPSQAQLDLAVAIPGARSDPHKGIIITAEAPSVSAVSSAFGAGWAISRYTDRETLIELLGSEPWKPEFALPREMRLPVLRRLARNRHLAVRGVDPRDIVRVPLSAFKAWRSNAGDSPLLIEVRRYQATLKDETVSDVAIPRVVFEDAQRSGDPVATELRRLLGKDSYEFGNRPLKRPSDLLTAWTPPREGAKRFALEDGRLPVSIMELAPDIVPAQRLFIIDGDGSVPALFTSRLFDVWARATLSRSTSWVSRFSVSNTFETLPIPKEFFVLHGDAVNKQLRLAKPAGEFASLVRALEEEPRRLGSPLGSDHNGGWAGHPYFEEINAALLSMFDLQSNATDLDILGRLLAVNQSSE